MTALAALAAGVTLATPASAQFNATVREEAFGGAAQSTQNSITTNTPAVLSGHVGADLAAPGHAADTYAITASAGHLSVASHLTENARGNVDGAHTEVSAQMQDRLTLRGAPAGKNLILHKTVDVTGGASFTKAFKGPNSTIEVSSDLRIGGGGDAIFAEAPFFPALGGGPVDATSRHTDSNTSTDGLPTDRDLLAPASIDYSILFDAGQAAFIEFGLDLTSETFGTGDGVTTFTGSYNLNFDTGPGFFTLADANGHDTGVRIGSSGLSVHSASGFDFLAVAGAGAGGVPEPAAWSLMILGFAGVGAGLRSRRRRLQDA